ncbi:MAG: asparagine synthase-related protein [Actinomycetota bacterium]
MSPLAARWSPAPAVVTAADDLLVGPVLKRWSDQHFAVAMSGGRISLAVDEDLVVAVEGRLDDAGGGPSASLGAADAVTAQWRRSGAAVLDELLGDFLIVVYDRATRRVTAGRDIVGARPGFVSTSRGEHLVFTHLAGVAEKRGFDLVPDHNWTASYLRGDWPDAILTPYHGVSALLPGHIAVPYGLGWEQSRVCEWQIEEPSKLSVEAASDGFRDRFDAAVLARIGDVDGPVAVATSGGLDSTSALVTARAIRPDADLVALAIPFTDPEGDERHLQVEAAAKAGARLHWVDISERGPFGSGPDEVFGRFGAPPLAPNWFFFSSIEQAALEAGVLQILDGEDADGVLSGNLGFLADLVARGQWITWTREALALRRVHDVRLEVLYRRSRVSLRRVGRAGGIGGPTARFATGRRGYVSSGGYLTRLMECTYDESTAVAGGMAHPFLDRRVVEYALALSWDHIVKGGKSKIVLRNAMRGRLPESIRNRSGKARLSAPFERMVTGSQRSWLDEGLALARRDRSGTFDAVDWTKYAESAKAGDTFPLFRVAMVALWHEWIAAAAPGGIQSR